MQKAKIFGYPVQITTQEEAVGFVLDAMQNSRGMHVVTINPEMMATADSSPELSDIIRQSGLVIPDSTGIMLAIKSLGIFNAEKIPGIEFCEKLLEICAEKGLRAAFLGGSPGVVQKLEFPGVNIVFSGHGYFKDEQIGEITGQLQKSMPHLLLVGLGCPKQEFFIRKIGKDLPETVMIGVGGSFDVWAKKIKRAPVFFRIFGLEWFYRLLAQPERFKRMFPVLPIFFLRIMFDRKNLDRKYENE